MKMYLVFGYKVKNFLFKDVSVSTVEGIIAICAIVMVLVLFYESIKIIRSYVSEKLFSEPETTSKPEKSKFIPSVAFSKQNCERTKSRALQTVLYVLQTFLGYIIMLIVMSFNFWIIITVLMASGISYYLYGMVVTHKSSMIPIELASKLTGRTPHRL